jgi:RNA polymerase sigma factor (sigma-70 family)
MAGFNAEALRAPQETVVTAADSPGPAAASGPNWAELVQKIKLDDQSGMEDLYRVFSRGVRFYLCRQLGPQDLEDKVHDTFLIVVQAVRRGELREPERLMGFVRTVVRRQVAGHIDQAVHSRRQQVGLESGTAVVDLTRDPEETAIRQQHEEIARTVLNSISKRDREILTRFYLLEQSQDQICTQMNLTETQFRLLKSRAKARFGELGKRRLARRRGLHFS